MVKKAKRAAEAVALESIPNVGPAIAGDLRRLGIDTPSALIGQDPCRLYVDLCILTGARQDPCVLDTFIAITRFMAGDQPHPWWHYTKERKRMKIMR